jgi:hypothetical protein
MSSRKNVGTHALRRTSLAIGLGLCLVGTGAIAQSNASGAIFGATTAAPGQTIHIVNKGSGLTRDVPVDSSGRYRASSLPTGTYTVSLQKDGKTVSTRDNVAVNIAGGADVSFAASAQNAQNLEGVSVVASALPSIDVSAVDSTTVLTAEQLAKIPLARSVNAAALLAPGAVQGSTGIVGNNGQGNLLSLGGGAQSENVYNINGYNVTNALDNLGYFELPFGAIDQEQVLTGGYGVEFGRSTGGVVNVITKRGTNEWKGSLEYFWTPPGLADGGRSVYNPANRPGSQYAGKIRSYRGRDLSGQDSLSLTLGGPLIKDKLFFFAAADFTRTDSQAYNAVNPFLGTQSAGLGFQKVATHAPRWMTKIDWNINDRNIIEFTGAGSESISNTSNHGINANAAGNKFTYDPAAGPTSYAKSDQTFYLGKYTGYLTDDLTVTGTFGRTKQNFVNVAGGVDPNCAGVLDRRSNNVTPNIPITSACKADRPGRIINRPQSGNSTHGFRVDVEYRLGSHDLRGGIDNQTLRSQYGDFFTGNGAVYLYSSTSSPGKALNPKLGVGAPNALNYGRKITYTTGGQLRTEQNAQFLQDRWQVSDNVLLSIGVRNEQFSNYNNNGGKYISQRHQLAPRLGASWDVFGDSTLKIYGNAGRYHLGVPNSVALRGAGGALYTTQYFNYTGVDANGLPTGTTPIGPLTSANSEFGQARDPSNTHTKNLKPYYQDEYILGFDQAINSDWTYGVKATYRNLRSLIDDMSDSRAICQAAVNQGLNFNPAPGVTAYDTCLSNYGFAGLAFNPGSGIDFTDDVNGDGIKDHIKVSAKDLGQRKPVRKYVALNFHLTHPFDGKWYGNVEYLLSRSFGNTEGQINSDLDQANVGQSETWDFPEFQYAAGGELPNSRRHQIKATGFYQVTPELLLGANLNIASGRPKNCLSAYYLGNTDPSGYGASAVYFTCDGKFEPRGSRGHLPWTYTLSLSASYRPAFANNQLEFGADVFNVLNSQTGQAVQEVKYTNDPAQIDSQYGGFYRFQQPRYVRLSVKYDFSL